MDRYSITGCTVQDVQSLGGDNIQEARNVKIIFATLTDDQANLLRSLGAKVNKVGSVKPPVPPSQVAPPLPIVPPPVAIYTPEFLVWAAGWEDLRSITSPPLYGAGLNLAFIDTGIRETHEKIAGRVVYSKNFTSDPMEDAYDHGSGVASIALSIAPLCNILNLKVIDSAGYGTEEAVVLAVDECIGLWDTRPEIAPAVINMSIGAPDDGNPDNPMRVACREAIARGIWIFAAAGNEGPDAGTMNMPACEQYVGAVGAVGYEPFTISKFSSRGPSKEGLIKPDGVFFGENISMASSKDDTAMVVKSGTSFAVPLASGMGILYYEGVYRNVQVTRPITIRAVPMAIQPMTEQELVDTWLYRICLKPEGELVAKDNNYGYGLPFGPLIKDALQIREGVDFSTVTSAAAFLMMMGMVVMTGKMALGAARK